MIIKELPVTERPREKMIRYGCGSMSNAELLAVLIGSGTRNKSAIELAQDILAMDESGIIEHIAQSASAFAGYKAIIAGATEPPLGYIGEVKKFRCHHRPAVGDCLHTVVSMGVEVNGVTLLTSQTFLVSDKSEEVTADSTLVADTKMKIFIKSDSVNDHIIKR